MYFRKQPYSSNFEFAKTATADGKCIIGKQNLPYAITEYNNGILRFESKGNSWSKEYVKNTLTLPKKISNFKDKRPSISIGSKFDFKYKDPNGDVLLNGIAKESFGKSGNSFMLQFEYNEDFEFYGMGEKYLGMELSNVKTKFWNTDVWGDFAEDEYINGKPDPAYISIPYLIIKQKNTFVGIFINNSSPSFMNTSANLTIASQLDIDSNTKKYINLGAEIGEPDFFFIYGPSLAELTEKFQKLLGTTPLPPAWALGYHQCRWGYKSLEDLKMLDKCMTDNNIPCDGLWLDIEYMDSYKVFTINKKLFPNMAKEFKKLADKGRKIIPILDPGVKKEKGYEICDNGRKNKVFCVNPQGKDFIGQVWPGETLFPDFSLKKTRKWWSKQVTKFVKGRFPAAWLDMNDPATGSVDNTAMLFDSGKKDHASYHNQYANAMAMASKEGLEKAYPNKRPFLLSRSASAGMSCFAAIWTGDNYSNYHHLKGSISCTLNLALSGIPFNGPDVGGFGGTTWNALISDWHKACFLFPFFRNHSVFYNRNQEPWTFDKKSLGIMKFFIQLRYKFRPYLYNLYVEQEKNGSAILRPLFYDFNDTNKLPLGKIDDQFMVGPSIMQAPFVEEKAKTRKVLLPKISWYSFSDAKWISGGKTVNIKPKNLKTPLYFREGAILPLSKGLPTTQEFNSTNIEFHIFLKKDSKIEANYLYTFDDAESLNYKQGKRSELKVLASVKNAKLNISAELIKNAFGECKFIFVVYDKFTNISLNNKTIKADINTNLNLF